MDKRKMLLLIDCQYDFLEGGKLGVEGATQKMNDLVAHIEKNDYECAIFTCDWHPTNHCSFAENGGEWNTHCIQHTLGASIYQPLFDIVSSKIKNFKVLTKGDIPSKEEYSIMSNYLSSKELIRFIERSNVDEIDVCGIMSSFCVLNTVKDLANEKVFAGTNSSVKEVVLARKLNVQLDFIAEIDKHEALIDFCNKNVIKMTQNKAV